MRLSKFLFFLFFPFLLHSISVQPHHKTAFIGAPGEIDFLLTYSNYATKHFWNKHGKKLPTYNRFDRDAYLLYSDYAFNDANKFTLNAGFAHVTESLNGNSSAFEDVEASWQHLLYAPKEAALSAEVVGIIPVGNRKSSIRYGRWGVQANVLYSKYFCICTKTAWYDLLLGYRYYDGFVSDQLRASTAVGTFITDSLQLIASSQLEWGLSKGRSSLYDNNVVFNPMYRLVRVKLEANWRLYKYISLSGGGYWHAYGRNVGAGGGFFVGVWIDV